MKNKRSSPVDELPGDHPELTSGIRQVLYSEEQIRQQVAELAGLISRDYAGRNPLMIGVLKGVVFFMADLLRALTIPAEMDFIAISSYSPEARAHGMVRLVKDLETSISGRHVLFVEDVIDTGLTLHYLLQNLRARQPASLEVCVLFDKSSSRLLDIPIKYKGFDLPPYFVVGYGLDFREKYRNLPFVGLLSPEVFQNKKTANQG
ncbi:MAG TPA: hypoxanthine phosphoribosyltransferase [Anaerolineales bacterium]|jgi:hypoxanthine phosphoribosyltransferase|nr:hypoxanthine phosphoribosyltransferase [Anaerolineales bacterium]